VSRRPIGHLAKSVSNEPDEEADYNCNHDGRKKSLHAIDFTGYFAIFLAHDEVRLEEEESHEDNKY